ncbi:MAG: response regulator [Deltaproteobacteria bacterium]|nr:response regulator [Deltaproteobacteria bacterium]
MTDAHFLSIKRTIMVVDDEPELVTIVRLMLEQEEFNVKYAYSGSQLFAVLKEQKPDLIILDVMMPEMYGLEVLARLKSAPETSSIPVVLLTAMVLYEKRHMVRYENIIKGYRMEADYYITKPFTETQLMTGINLFLSGDQGHSGESPYQGQLNNG